MEYVVNERFFERVLEIKAETDAIAENNDEIVRYVSSNIR